MHAHQKKRSASNELPLFASRTAGAGTGTGGHISSFSTASSLSRQPLAGRGPGYASLTHQQRDASPPASAYFSGFSGSEQQPTASEDASAHFAYSTTLRRHNTLTISDSGHMSGSAAGPSSASSASSKLRSLARIVSNEGVELLGRVISGRPSTEAYRMEEGLMMNGSANVNGHVEKSTEETPSSIHAHTTVEDIASHFNTSLTDGLSSSAIPPLREIHGYNEFSVAAPEHVLIKFVKSIYEQPLILLLFGSAVVSAVMHNIDDAVSITIAILIVLTVGFVQERRSEKSLEALNKLVPHYCHLTRDGQTTNILANELVPGDLVTFSVGDRIPADIRLTTAVDLEIDESSLTGETKPAVKSIEAVSRGTEQARTGDTVALAERTCIAYMGTLVRNGHGKGIVIATGGQTEFGVIFSMMQDVEEKRTPLQLNMDELAKKLSMFSFGVIGVICVIGILQKRHWLEMFTIGVSLAVAAIPEGLPIVTTVTLALGVLRMSRRNAIVKKLPSVEALGSVSVICSDKTGTLTKNEQTVIEIYTVDEMIVVENGNGNGLPPNTKLTPTLRKALQVGSVCNNARENELGVFVGQSTDVALINVLRIFDLSDPQPEFNRLSERPFNSEQKYMAVSGSFMNDPDTRERCYMKGSLESVLDRCKFYYVSDDASPALDTTLRNMILAKATEAASRGLRVIALAYGFGSVDTLDQTQSLVFVGFQCMLDPPRPGVADSIAALQAGGVHVVMITGDAEHTALAIARQLGMIVPSGGAGCVTGTAIDRMSPAQLRDRIGSVAVFARTTPRHKMAIVEAYRARGDVVAMTGDGVNDAPALKMADIGVSMGKSGTDVAKEAADMILVDDNFSTILSAVEEGKSIFYNIQNFLSFQLSTAVAALTLITMSTMFGLHNPLNAMQILFINILMDGPPSQSLGVDPADPAVMRKPPRKKDEEVISRRVVGRVVFSASVIVFGTLFIYATALGDSRISSRDQTMTFTTFVFLDLVSALQNRGLGCHLTQNKMLITTVGISVLVQLALVYVPVMQRVFQTTALGGADVITLVMLSGTAFVVHEMRRRYERWLNANGDLGGGIVGGVV
ncbi:Ca-transporting ATPase [Fomitiporia mediterranea MF3/22]|uniref:Ca-transporting ATPase n=1 Tax=Fomitiporia mediterranea (strain MF3/22) TaxID=694068 RepID=UPI00044096C1|nr:Ca-transporting ATPase [Fomitiporia mediterranea MF3/22]EJD08323.1 Ca-transporting ATPase [Fomitiporia mediterranea MF3/22]